MKPELAQLLVALDKFNSTENLSIYIPSVGRQVSFAPLTIKQQKDILKSAFDTKVSVFLFTETINSIIAESCKEKINFNIIDKAHICLHFKQFFFKGKSFGKIKNEDVEFDLTAHIASIKHVGISANVISRVINTGSIFVECCVPSLAYETSVVAESKTVISKLLENKKEENIKDIVGEIFIYEILKFIKSIKYTFNNEPVTVDMTALSLKDKANIFESLPLTTNNLIIDYIKTVRDFEKTYLKAGDVEIAIDPIFFNKTE